MLSNTKEIIFRFNKGRPVSIKQLGKTVYLTKEKAKEGRKNLKRQRKIHKIGTRR